MAFFSYDEEAYNDFPGESQKIELSPVRRAQLHHFRSTLQWGGVQRLLPALQWGEVPSQVKGLRPARRNLLQCLLPALQWGEVPSQNIVLRPVTMSTSSTPSFYSGAEFKFGFPFASGKSPTASSCATVGGGTLAKSGTASRTTSSSPTSSPAPQWVKRAFLPEDQRVQ